jgi:DNA-directed RNA polymerase subunit RPC12/RpoP
VASLPKDNFRRERERRIRSAIEFENLYWRTIRRNPLPARYTINNDEIKQSVFLREVPSQKTFHCTNCGQVIVTTDDDRIRRAKIQCPRCNEKYKLHPPYATHGGEIIPYEE